MTQTLIFVRSDIFGRDRKNRSLLGFFLTWHFCSRRNTLINFTAHPLYFNEAIVYLRMHSSWITECTDYIHVVILVNHCIHTYIRRLIHYSTVLNIVCFSPSKLLFGFALIQNDSNGVSNWKIIFGPLHTNKIGRLFNSIYHSIPWSAIICTRDQVDKTENESVLLCTDFVNSPHCFKQKKHQSYQ